ncbi:MAG: hypothetical protein ACREV3_04525 [Gammaproteobacteria bacterium]
MILKQISETLRKVLHLAQTPDPEWLQVYHPPKRSDTKNQFAIFLKPEITALQEGVKFAELLRCILDALQQWEVRLGAIRLLRSDYLARHQIMDQHYGVINKISKHGDHAISEQARTILKSKFCDEIEAGAEILGGHQFLARFPAFSAFALSTLSDNLEVTKLGAGTYCLRVTVAGEVFLVLNAFHPHQLENFTTGNKVIVVMEGFSFTPWADLRRKMIGATNPAFAFQASIRQSLLSRREEFCLSNVSQSANGIHLSAGPLEGMVELTRFFSDPDKKSFLELTKTSFGRLLREKGASQEFIDALATNPDLEVDGHIVSAFDLTEELDAEEAAAKLRSIRNAITA